MLSIQERKLIIKLYNQGKTQEYIADLIGCSQPTVHRWVQNNKSGRTFKTLPRPGRPTKLTKQTLNSLRNLIVKKIQDKNSQYGSISTKEISKIIREEVGNIYSFRHIQRIMHKMDFSLITPRPEHLRHDQEKVNKFRDEFKKNSNRSMWVMN